MPARRKLHLPLEGCFWNNFFDKKVQHILSKIKKEHSEFLAIWAYGETMLFICGSSSEYNNPERLPEDVVCAGPVEGFPAVYQKTRHAAELLLAIEKSETSSKYGKRLEREMAHNPGVLNQRRKLLGIAPSKCHPPAESRHLEFPEMSIGAKGQTSKNASRESNKRKLILRKWPQLRAFLPLSYSPKLLKKESHQS